MRLPEELRRLPRSALTDAEAIAVRVNAYYRHTACSCDIGLLEFTGMRADEYAAWMMHGTVPERPHPRAVIERLRRRR
jgi:hypothetical protein